MTTEKIIPVFHCDKLTILTVCKGKVMKSPFHDQQPLIIVHIENAHAHIRACGQMDTQLHQNMGEKTAGSKIFKTNVRKDMHSACLLDLKVTYSGF